MCAAHLRGEPEVNEISHLWSNKRISIAQRDASTLCFLSLPNIWERTFDLSLNLAQKKSMES